MPLSRRRQAVDHPLDELVRLVGHPTGHRPEQGPPQRVPGDDPRQVLPAPQHRRQRRRHEAGGHGRHAGDQAPTKAAEPTAATTPHRARRPNRLPGRLPSGVGHHRGPHQERPHGRDPRRQQQLAEPQVRLLAEPPRRRQRGRYRPPPLPTRRSCTSAAGRVAAVAAGEPAEEARDRRQVGLPATPARSRASTHRRPAARSRPAAPAARTRRRRSAQHDPARLGRRRIGGEGGAVLGPERRDVVVGRRGPQRSDGQAPGDDLRAVTEGPQDALEHEVVRDGREVRRGDGRRPRWCHQARAADRWPGRTRPGHVVGHDRVGGAVEHPHRRTARGRLGEAQPRGGDGAGRRRVGRPPRAGAPHVQGVDGAGGEARGHDGVGVDPVGGRVVLSHWMAAMVSS